METIEITNFSGRLTRLLNGDLNSGFAKFVPSWGYDPFSKPMNLTWFEQPTNITGPITDIPVGGKVRYESNSSLQYAYIVGNAGQLYKINTNTRLNANVDSVVGIGSVTANGETYNYGASLEFFGTPERLYVGGDKQINAVPVSSLVGGTFGAGDAVVGSTGNYSANVYRPLKQFIGELLFGNGPTIGVIDSTNTVTSSIIGLSFQGGTKSIYSQMNPPFPPESSVQDIDVSPNNDYAFITASQIVNEDLSTVGSDGQAAAASDGTLYKWNGVDATATAAITIPSYAVTALQTYLQNNFFFSTDSFGASLNDGVNKVLTLTGNKAPKPNATGVNGNFMFWISPEINAAGTATVASMFYFGALDRENPPGLYRVMRYTTTLANGFVYQTPLNLLTNNSYKTVNNSVSSIVTAGLGKHYFSTYEINSGTTATDLKKLYSFLVTSSGTGTPQLGVYETQTQLFSKRISVKQIRVYTEPTVANNGFQVDCIGSDGAVITNSATNTYTFAAGSDVTALQGSLERINFNPTMNDTYCLGIRITNTGTVNMTIKKVEIDWEYSGK